MGPDPDSHSSESLRSFMFSRPAFTSSRTSSSMSLGPHQAHNYSLPCAWRSSIVVLCCRSTLLGFWHFLPISLCGPWGQEWLLTISASLPHHPYCPTTGQQNGDNSVNMCWLSDWWRANIFIRSKPSWMDVCKEKQTYGHKQQYSTQTPSNSKREKSLRW